MQDYRELLIEELNTRKQSNPYFSLRAFARVLGMSPSHLSHLINGKKNLTKKQALKIAEKLSLSPLQTQKMFGSTILPATVDRSVQVLQEDEFKLVSDWFYMAMLSLGELKGNQANPYWISQKLGITPAMAYEAFERLLRLGLIETDRKTFKQSSKPLDTVTDVPSTAVRKYHKQNLELAKEKIDKVDVKQRDFSAITMAVNPKKIEKVKKMIADFKWQISQELEDGERSEVYTMCIQLFPVTPVEPTRTLSV